MEGLPAGSGLEREMRKRKREDAPPERRGGESDDNREVTAMETEGEEPLAAMEVDVAQQRRRRRSPRWTSASGSKKISWGYRLPRRERSLGFCLSPLRRAMCGQFSFALSGSASSSVEAGGALFPCHARLV